MYDIVIIGAGVSGCSIARELSRYRAKICVVEKCEDVCSGTSKANSGIVHAGFDAAAGSLMARLNVRGNERMEPLSKELDFPFRRNGSLVVMLRQGNASELKKLYENGIANGVKDLRILTREELSAMEPNVSSEAVAALYAPTGGIVCPFGLTIALAENACTNGVKFYFNTEVKSLESVAGKWLVNTSSGQLEAKCVVNAAGVYADSFNNMVSSTKLHITPRRGEYCLLDKCTGDYVSHTIFQLPVKKRQRCFGQPNSAW